MTMALMVWFRVYIHSQWGLIGVSRQNYSPMTGQMVTNFGYSVAISGDYAIVGANCR